jgi:MiAMP1
MLSHRFRSGRPARKVVAGALVTLGAVGALAMSAAPAALAATSAPAVAHGATNAHVVPAVATSEFIVYSGGNYGGRHQIEEGCGIHNFPYALKSYEWIALGQSGNMYNVKNGAGRLQYTFSANTSGRSPNANGWKSIFIVC